MVRVFFLIKLIAPRNTTDSGFQVLDSSLCQWNLDYGFQARFSAIPDSCAVFWIQKPWIPESTSKIFPDSRNQIHRLHAVRFRKALNSALHETRDFKMPRRRRQRERQKSNWLNKQNNNSARASPFFLYISLPSLRDYEGKMHNFTFYGGRKQVTAKFSVSF